MGRKLKFDVRKRSSRKPSDKIGLNANNVKDLCKLTPTMVNAETQTDTQWFYDSKEVQTESEPLTTVGTQTEPDVILQEHQDNLTSQDVRTGNDECLTTKCCEGIVDEKYASLIKKHDGLFKDATGM